MNASSAVLVCLIVIFVFVLWPQQVLDETRQRLFALRDDLFDYAQKGNIEFSNPAYCMVRSHLNRLIRNAHIFSIWQLVMSAKLIKRESVSLNDPFFHELAEIGVQLSPEQTAHLRKTFMRGLTLISIHVFHRSFPISLTSGIARHFFRIGLAKVDAKVSRVVSVEIKYA